MAKKVNARVSIPKNPVEQLVLAEKVYNKHKADGIKSPLNALEDNDWETEGPKIELALAKHKEAEELNKKMELAYAERNKSIEGISSILSSSRDLLKSIYSKTPKRLGEWGFETAESPKSAKKLASTDM